MNNSYFIFEEILEEVGAFLAIYGVITFLASCASIVLFILQGLGLFEMSKTLNLNNPWISFIPLVWVFSLGRVGQQYVKQDGRRSAKLGGWLLAFQIIMIIFSAVFIGVVVFAVVSIISNTDTALINDTAMTLEMFSPFIFVIAAYFVLLAVAIAHKVLYYIALWRTFSIFDYHNATLYTVLSIFFSFLSPIFLYMLRKKLPKLTFEERMGLTQIEVQ